MIEESSFLCAYCNKGFEDIDEYSKHKKTSNINCKKRGYREVVIREVESAATFPTASLIPDYFSSSSATPHFRVQIENEPFDLQNYSRVQHSVPAIASFQKKRSIRKHQIFKVLITITNVY
jgi:hypothetical protein